MELRSLKANVGKKSKRNLDQTCEGGGYLTVMPISQDGNDISMEEFRDSLQWRLDLLLQNPPQTCDGFSDPFMVDHMCH